MIEYGIALLVVCGLSFFDKRAMPYALTLLAGWLLGFGPAEAWPAISLGICLMTLIQCRKDGTSWGAAIHAIAVGMLLMDVVYWSMLVQGVYIGVEYAETLNAGLTAQLILVGYQGVKNGWIGLLDWRGSGVRRDALSGARHAKEA